MYTLALALAATLTVISALLASPASAAHYYGIADFSQSNYGGFAWLWSGALNVPNQASQFVDDDLWDVNSASSHWIEAGLIIGTFCLHFPADSPCDKAGTYHVPRFFWTDDRAGLGYQAHVDVSDNVVLGTYYRDTIHRSGSDTWNVAIGPWFGTSTSNPLVAAQLETGTEETTQSGQACNGQHGLIWWDTHNTQHDGWPGASTVGASNPPFIRFVATADFHDWSPSSESGCY